EDRAIFSPDTACLLYPETYTGPDLVGLGHEEVRLGRACDGSAHESGCAWEFERPESSAEEVFEREVPLEPVPVRAVYARASPVPVRVVHPRTEPVPARVLSSESAARVAR